MQLLTYSCALFSTMTTLILSIYSLRAPNWIKFDTPDSSPFQYSSTYGLRQKCDRSNLHPEYQCRVFPDRQRDCTSSKDLVKMESKWWKEMHQNLSRNQTSTLAHHVSKMVPLGSGLVDDGFDTTSSSDSPIIKKDSDGDENFGFCEKWNTAAYTSEFSIVIGVISMFCIFIVILGNDHRKQHGWKVCGGLIAVHGLLQTITWVLIINVFNTDNRFYFGSKLSTSSYIAISSSVIDIIAFTGLFAVGFTFNEDPREDYEPIIE
ncbi:hypothetical protein DFH28DRAFT_495351 [Melampsora americana]|nr:hypothetical protein DFH28DRAFT_495351 [Melampsora americana]